MFFSGKVMIAAAVIGATLGAASAALAQQKPDEALKMRQGLMQTVKMNFGPIGAFAQGKGDLPADAEARADNLIALSKIVPMAWRKGTESLPESATKPEAFTSADFPKGWSMLGDAAGKLKLAAASGDADAIKAAAGGVGKVCKGCHDNFKKE